jgi:hypothetical protein
LQQIGLLYDTIVYVTGPTTFAFSYYWGPPLDPTGQPGGICNVVGSNTVNYVYSLQIPDGSTIPYEVSARITGAFPGSNHLVNIPMGATDDCCAAIARRIRDNLPKGRKVYVEYSNENWNLSGLPSNFFTHAMGVIGAWCAPDNGAPQAYCARAAQHHKTFINIFNQADINGNTNRGSEIVRMFSGQFSYPGGTQQPIISYANANGIPIDVMAVADYRDYIDQGSPNPSATYAGAACASSWPTSRSYLTTMPWTRAMYLSYYRHCLKYSSTFNGPTGFYAQNQAVLASYTVPPGQGQPPGYIPALVGYEGGVQTLVSDNCYTVKDPLGLALCNQLAHDMYYDPAMYDVEMAFYQSAQQGGMVQLPIYQLAGPFQGVGPASAVWTSMLWSGQPAGKGDGSLATNNQHLTNKFWIDTEKDQDITNATVRIAAWRDWADASAPLTAPTVMWTSPPAGSKGVATSAHPSAAFNQAMSSSTITTSTFLLNHGSTPIPGTVTYNSSTHVAMFKPTSALTGGALYTATLTTGVQSAAGVALASPCIWTFSTASGASAAKWFPGLGRP